MRLPGRRRTSVLRRHREIEIPPDRPTSAECPVCGHFYEIAELTEHHLVPRSRRGRETVRICSPCRRQIHALFSEKELERELDTVEKILGAEEIQPWLAWIRKRKPTGRIRARRSNRRKARGGRNGRRKF